VIYCCVSEIFYPELRPFNSRCPRILQVGTGAHNKNVERVAAALVGINCRWVIIGRLSSAQRVVIERYGIDYENYVGLSEDALLSQYKLSDMLVFASTYEGFGLPIVEANAVGRPVVTSNLCSMPEVAGGAACLVDPYSVESIREGILRVIEDDDFRIGLVNAGILNANRFRPVVIAEQYAELYRQVYSGLLL
jgi:glycosyltransferase involved in cell wall biosynthesis